MTQRAPTASIGRYQLDGLAGEGASAQVWRGTDALLHRTVAVKILKPAIAADDAVVGRFFTEARAMAGLSDPSIVAIYDMIADGGRHALVMEYVDGPSLAQLLQQNGTIDAVRAVAIARDIARALHVAHARGILHRDVKPANVLMTAAGTAKVTDFGLAKALEETDSGATLAGGLLGSTSYISPEQAQGRPLTPASDLYGLGVVMHQMLTGRLPFSGSSALATAVAHVREPVPTAAALAQSMSPALAAIVHRLLAKDPAARYRSAPEFIAALDDARVAPAAASDAPTELGGSTPRVARAPWDVKLFPARFAVPLIAAILALGLIAACAAGHNRNPAAANAARADATPGLALPIVSSAPLPSSVPKLTGMTAAAVPTTPAQTPLAGPPPGYRHAHHGHRGHHGHGGD